MIVLKPHDLPTLIGELERHLPHSLTVLMLAKNVYERNGRFAWPTIEFCVDQFPNLQVCLVRPAANSETQVPRPASPTVNLFATDPDVLESFLKANDALDWSQPIYFLEVPNHLIEKVYEIIDQKGKAYGSRERSDFRAAVSLFRPDSLPQCPQLPVGLTARKLTKSDIEQLRIIWLLELGGSLSECHQYLEFLLQNDFPSVGVFNEEHRLVGHAVIGADMSIMSAFVDPAYRNRKIFQFILNFLCRSLFELGFEFAYTFVSPENIPSQTAVTKAGGELIPDCLTHWVTYRPEEKPTEK